MEEEKGRDEAVVKNENVVMSPVAGRKEAEQSHIMMKDVGCQTDGSVAVVEEGKQTPSAGAASVRMEKKSDAVEEFSPSQTRRTSEEIAFENKESAVPTVQYGASGISERSATLAGRLHSSMSYVRKDHTKHSLTSSISFEEEDNGMTRVEHTHMQDMTTGLEKAVKQEAMGKDADSASQHKVCASESESTEEMVEGIKKDADDETRERLIHIEEEEIGANCFMLQYSSGIQVPALVVGEEGSFQKEMNESVPDEVPEVIDETSV